MELKIANYTIESLDNYNFKLSRDYEVKGKITKQFVGYYGNPREAVLRIIKDRTLNSDYQGSLNDFLRVYDNINKTTIAELREALGGMK